VLAAIYLVFNQGYAVTSDADQRREDPGDPARASA
jgi:predicted RNA polymerase sigma factor